MKYLDFCIEFMPTYAFEVSIFEVFEMLILIHVMIFPPIFTCLKTLHGP